MNKTQAIDKIKSLKKEIQKAENDIEIQKVELKNKTDLASLIKFSQLEGMEYFLQYYPECLDMLYGEIILLDDGDIDFNNKFLKKMAKHAFASREHVYLYTIMIELGIDLPIDSISCVYESDHQPYEEKTKNILRSIITSFPRLTPSQFIKTLPLAGDSQEDFIDIFISDLLILFENKISKPKETYMKCELAINKQILLYPENIKHYDRLLNSLNKFFIKLNLEESLPVKNNISISKSTKI